MPTVNLLIKGRVQGVFYRASAKEKADELLVTGWVKNTVTGNVEAVVSGTDQQLEEFIQWCRQGPRRAEVTDIVMTQIEETAFKDFKVVR